MPRLGLVIVAVMLGCAVDARAGDWPGAGAETSGAGQHPGLTRLVLDVSELTRFYTHVADDGRRILVGIPSVDWEANRHRLQSIGLIARFGFMRRGLKRGLLVIHTKVPTRVEHQFTLGPDMADHKGNRLVLDLVPRDLAGKPPMPKDKG